ncbi:hypothetical protein BKA82DRAFT_3978389, partial [Pisolithus tinctorius]
AWSGTCCLEKENSADLQEVIEAMVVWYRKSTLTIAYLADVSENNSIASSKWFRRRRTLLVPRAVLFYTQNLSLYKNLESPNRKADRARGIASRFLTDFSPRMDERVRDFNGLASSWRINRPDIAHSLFEIFDLHLPVLCGELAEEPLGRLPAEITR